jgi:hypothetical protein
MNTFFDFDTQLLLQAFGLVFIGIGVIARLGFWKKWYWRSKSSVYSYLPLGVIFLMYSYNDTVKERLGSNYWIYLLAYAIPIAVGVWWVARPPAFVKPDWVLWVESYPQPVLEAMQKEAENDPSWESHVKNQEEVARWARSLEKARPGGKGKARAKK